MGLEKPVTIVRAERVESETPRPLGLVDVVGNHSRVSDTTQRRDDVRAGATDGKGTANAVSGISKAVDSQSDNRKGTTLPTLELTEARKMSHTVKKNDSLWKIAADNLKDKTKHGSDIDSYVKQIVEANKEKHPTLAKRPDRIQIGMNLQLPEFKQRSSADARKQSKSEGKLAPEADKNGKPEARISPEAERQEELEEKLAPAEKQEKPEAKVAPEADKQQEKPEAKVAPEAEKKQEKPEAKVAPEAEKQEQKPEAKVAAEAEKQEQKPEAKV
ncbi:MAG: LysM peptidoglycan-binding domain-containing protein, partial [Candidatus Obscuribacterales bacterium]|nr:LysM peptidoglycan-binding domain-containing protein [Candidatus Obscuribacterales bacterium]